jgi:hypothetical protein
MSRLKPSLPESIDQPKLLNIISKKQEELDTLFDVMNKLQTEND